MRALLPLLASGALVACASPAELRSRAMNTSPPDLCYLMAASQDSAVREAAWYGVSQRSIDCSPYSAMIAQRIQADRNRLDAGLQLLRASRPQASPVRQPTYCRTVEAPPGTWRTVCD